MKMKGKIGGIEGAIVMGVFMIAAFAVVLYGTGTLSITGQVTAPAPETGLQPAIPGYAPFSLDHVYLYLYDAMDLKSTFGGADDAQCRVWKFGQYDFLGPYVDTDSDASTGQIDLAAKRVKTDADYSVLCYENDGGTPVYANKVDKMHVGQLSPEVTAFTYDFNINMLKEGTFTESACDSATAAFDEGGDAVTLNKTASTVQGVLTWDCTVAQSTSGAALKDPVLIFRENPASPMTDINDVEAIWVSVKTGSGVTVPAGNLVSQFKAAAPVALTSVGMLTSADAATVTVKIQLPAAEADVGTGSFQMIYDDLGDYRAKDLDYDVRAADETTTFTINT